MMTNQEPPQYVKTASRIAVEAIKEELSEESGRLLDFHVFHDTGNAWWLTVQASVEARPDVTVEFSRVLLLDSGPDKEAELTGAIVSTHFMEQVRMRLISEPEHGGVVSL